MTDHPITRTPDDNRSDPETPALEMQPISKSFPGARALSDMSLRDKAPFDIVSAQATRIETVFRYANMFDRALDLMASGPIDLKP